MKSTQRPFSFLERFMVVAIILLVSAMAIQNVLHTVKLSEERSFNNAAVDYATVKSMYAEQHQAVTPNVVAASARTK